MTLGTGDTDGFNINNIIAFDGSGSFEIEVSISNVNGVLDDNNANNTQVAVASAVLAAQYPDGKLLRDYLYYHPSDAPDNCPTGVCLPWIHW